MNRLYPITGIGDASYNHAILGNRIGWQSLNLTGPVPLAADKI